MKKKNSGGILKSLAILFAAAVIIGFAVLGWFWNEYKTFVETPLNIPAAGSSYTVPKGASLRVVAQELEGAGILSNPLYLRLLGRVRGDAAEIKVGEYALSQGMTPDSLLDLLVSGKVVEYSLTLVEGWTFKQVLDAVRKHDKVRHTLNAEVTHEDVMEMLGRSAEHPEGRFFPDTYLFPRNTSDIDILKRALTSMDRVLEEEWAGRAEGLPLETSYDALILASIIEKETGKAPERPEIAGVFIRRLNKGMLLQTDPTVIYGLGDKFDGNIRRRDLKGDTPYNTYVHAGLTPTPIAMPGRESIHAALHPADGKALYFVATGDGGHYFSETLNEHNRAVRKYQLKRKDG